MSTMLKKNSFDLTNKIYLASQLLMLLEEDFKRFLTDKRGW